VVKRTTCFGIPLLPDSGPRVRSLDLLRFAAIALVLLRHLYTCPVEISAPLHAITKTLATGGWIGVDLFFVLSGFLIGGLLFREYQTHGEISLKRFFLRRGLKIYPPFWVFIAFALFVETAHGGRLSNAVHWLPSELLFLQNYGTPGPWSYTWSLAVEEHFYLILPLALLVLVMKSRSHPNPFRRLPHFFGAVAVACLLLRTYLSVAHPFALKTHYLPTHLRIDSLLFGVLISYWFNFYPKQFHAIAKRHHRLFIPLGILLMLPAFAWEIKVPYMHTLGFTQLYIASGLLLVGFLGREVKPSAPLSLIAFVGSRSYSIYLWHGPASWFADERFAVGANLFNWSSWTLNYLGGAIFMGIAMAALVEFPVVKLRDRFFPSRTGPPPAAVESFNTVGSEVGTTGAEKNAYA
jgi:peptidoglycan/LPS O-acetylase OafA/YrhL